METIINRTMTEDHPSMFIFPELSSSGYLLENLTFSSALSLPDDIPEFIVKLSDEAEIHFGFPLLQEGLIYNAHAVLWRKKIIHIHKKLYLPTYGFFDEGRYFTPGSNLTPYDGLLGKSAVLICEDAFHPALVYALYESGVKHLIVSACSPARGINEEQASTSSYLAWKNRLEVYAQSFGIFCYYQNRAGSEDGVFFDGKSILASPNANAIEKAPENREVFVQEINLQDFEAAYQRGGPFHEENFDLNRRLFDTARKTRNDLG